MLSEVAVIQIVGAELLMLNVFITMVPVIMASVLVGQNGLQ